MIKNNFQLRKCRILVDLASVPHLPIFIACVRASRLLKGLKLRSRGGAGAGASLRWRPFSPPYLPLGDRGLGGRRSLS